MATSTLERLQRLIELEPHKESERERARSLGYIRFKDAVARFHVRRSLLSVWVLRERVAAVSISSRECWVKPDDVARCIAKMSQSDCG